MKLGELVAASGLAGLSSGLEGWRELEIRDVVSDSRRVEPGALFVALDGATVRGTDFAVAAVRAGAVAVVAARKLALGVPVLVVQDPRAALGALASARWGHPSERLVVVAVTGTNGKTTTATMIAEILAGAGHEAASLGTLGLWTRGGLEPGALTTPDCADLHRTLARLVQRGVTHVALEASSHALDQRRLAGVRVAAAVWTNLSRDHLDYHGSEERYAAAKLRLFTEVLAPGGPAFVNGDDSACRRAVELGLAEAWSAGADPEAPHQLAGIRASREAVTLVLHSPGHPPLRLRAPLLGDYNAANLAAAALVCRALGLEDGAIAAAVARLAAPPGRLQPIANDIGSLVLIDYAHTPDALARSLAVARGLCGPDGRLLVTFGCGGDRDRGKRPLMGEVAARAADLLLLTSDNPRGEEPEAILAAIEAGVTAAGAARLERLAPSHLAAVAGRAAYLVEPDRSLAIRRAIGALQVGDVLLIAGKGHERTQTIGGCTIAFSDAEVAAGWLRCRRRRGGGPGLREVDTGPEAFAFDGPDALRACGGSLLVGGRPTRSLCTDSRALPEEALFVALRGERFDGNDFIDRVLDAGAAGVVCATGRGLPHLAAARAAKAWILEVPDPLTALGDLARAHRARWGGWLVGITGSNGKTTTKELTAACLRAAGSVLATHANFNNRVGVPLTLARLRAAHRYAVVEMGTSEPGEIAELARIAAPDIGVVTNVGQAHLEGLGSVAAVAAEKTALLHALPAHGAAIIPAGEPLFEARAAGLPCRVLRFGEGPEADVLVRGGVRMEGLSQRFVARVPGTEVRVELGGPGAHLVPDALAALAVAHCLGLNPAACARMLAAYRPVGQRMRPTRIGPWLVLEDCYNANPASAEMALRTLAGFPGPRVAVLGTMLELGPEAVDLHARVGARAAARGIDVLIAHGPHADDYVRGAREAGLHTARVAPDIASAAALVREAAPDAGTILVKGSRGARMERVLQALTPPSAPAGEPEASDVPLAV